MGYLRWMPNESSEKKNAYHLDAPAGDRTRAAGYDIGHSSAST